MMTTKAPYRHYRAGNCQSGLNCRFGHDGESTPHRRMRLCKYYAQGKCIKGENCTFSHDPETIGSYSADPDCKSFNQNVTGMRDSYTLWSRQLPFKDEIRSPRPRPLGDALSSFFTTALALIEADADSMHKVLVSLADDTGLVRVNEVLDNNNLDTAEGDDLQKLYKLQLLPLFRIISHDSVLNSIVVEVRRATLLNDFYGINGRRAVRAFGAAVRFFSQSEEPNDDEIGPCLVTLSGVLEVNTSATVDDALRKAAEALLDLVNHQQLSGAPRIHYQRICTRLGLANDVRIDSRKQSTVTSNPISCQFSFSKDWPGRLSSSGSRHDNDREHIKDIQILPTAEEIFSGRTEYLPSDNPCEWHLGPGIAGLIDRQFRLVREDTVGQIRDAAKVHLQHLMGSNDKHTQAEARTCTYDDAHLVDIAFDRMKGLEFAVAFQQPKEAGGTLARRKAWWNENTRLAPDSLVCLLGSDGLVVFLIVSIPSQQAPLRRRGANSDDDDEEQHRHLHERYPREGSSEVAHAILKLANNTSNEVEKMTTRFGKNSGRSTSLKFSLLEFTGVLLPTFEPTLRALQHLASTLELPFAEVFAPDPAAGSGESIIPLPPYAQKPHFAFDASPLTTAAEPLHLRPSDPENARTLAEKTSLDRGQAEALSSCMSRSLACIQGPPGTGKSFTGVALMKMLLANKQSGKLGPIVLVTFTNHALDQSLEHLLDAGIKQIVRIGSRSKSEKVKPFSLRSLAQKIVSTRFENREKYFAHQSMDASTVSIRATLRDLDFATSDGNVMEYLRVNHRDCYEQLYQPSQVEDIDGFLEVKWGRSPRGLRDWLRGKTFSGPGRILSLPMHERQRLYAQWKSECSESLRDDLFRELRFHEASKEMLGGLRSDTDLRVLSNADIIGVTTSGLAQSLELLRKLGSKVLVIEEAGEVLEAHMLTAMLPSIEHLILIGDHMQLRPKAQNFELSSENPRSRINFDISLFERLVHPGSGIPGVPYVTLETQRRMHPTIANLIRSTLYPRLQDADVSVAYPEVVGMRRRLFWLDHKNQEDSVADKTSRVNSFEVDMVFALVRHLVRQGVYQPTDIAVLTPYLGQLRKLKKALSSFTEIVLSDGDVDDLAKDGEQENAAMESGEKTVQGPQRAVMAKDTLINTLRLATIDNFQGEEAKVVIISLVRSNKDRKCGFLKTSNRINVLLSRAKHGMYIIGNSDTAQPVEMWRNVVSLLEESGNIGTELELRCPRHPHTDLRVQTPDDFATTSPEAGCSAMCGRQLSCGHACEKKCHSDGLHNNVHCMKSCMRRKGGCSHTCKYECGKPCDPKCLETVPALDIQLPCGHPVTELPCWQHQNPASYRCDVQVERVVPRCGHRVTERCHVDVAGSSYRCPESCNTPLPCGHICNKTCATCNKLQPTGPTHIICSQICGRDYTYCKHSCRSVCHDDQPCPPCKEPCDVQCSHARCDKMCHEPCIPCAEEKCASRCPHSACSMPCAAPCDWVPCSKRCEKVLECGHPCPSVCGADCPTKRHCQICAPDEIKTQTADVILMAEYQDINLDESPCIVTPCDHIFTVDTLDRNFGMSDHYDMNNDGIPRSIKGNSDPFSSNELKTCPNCRGSLRSMPRYGRIVRRALLDESTKKFIAWSNSNYVPLAKRLQVLQETLIDSRLEKSVQNEEIHLGFSRKSPLQVLGDGGELQNRYKPLLALLNDTARFAKKVKAEEQPLQRVRDLVEVARLRRVSDQPSAEIFDTSHIVVQTRAGLLATALMIRSEVVALSDFINIWSRDRLSRPTLRINLSAFRQECDNLTVHAKKTKNVVQQVESHVFWAQSAVLERRVVESNAFGDDMENLSRIKSEGERRLDAAKILCNSHSGSTANIKHEVDEVRRMLNTQSYESEMRMIVAAMSTEFSGTGHWYTCANGHPFTVGECGMPMQSTRCPQCDAPIGGTNHQPAAGVQHAGEFERRFGAMRI